MEITINNYRFLKVIKLNGNLTGDCLDEIRRAISDNGSRTHVAIDLANVFSVDAAFLENLLLLKNERIRILNPSPEIMRTLKRHHLDMAFEIVENG